MTGFNVDLSDRRALVTGAGQGVGRGTAEALALAGAEVLINDIVTERAEEVAAAITAAGGKAAACPFDVTDYAMVSGMIESAGPVDILVNNAGNAGAEGWSGMNRFVDTEPADWDRFFQVNLYGVMHCCRAALPAMIEKGWGRIITIVSDAGRWGESGLAAYSAAKAGAAGLTRALATENGRYGVTVNNIALGSIRTMGTESAWDDPSNTRAKEQLRRYVIRRPGEPGDIAPLVVLLASPYSSWITGQTYPVDGGYTFNL